MIKGFITAIRTLSILPVPGKDADNMASSLPWFPVVGLLLGSILYALVYGARLISGNPWPQGIAAVILGCSVLLTRAIHLDGLGDWADGFGGRGDRVKTLAIMKDPHTGSFGVVAIALALVFKWVALTRLVECDSSIMIIAAFVISRAIMAELASTLPYARAEGGTAAPFVNNARPVHRFVALGVAAILSIVLVGPLAGAVAFCIGWIACRLFGWWCRRWLGGVTGDVLGACNEIVETGILFAGAFYGSFGIALQRFWS
jgi:adenosylcobinamide-GDP ribazoletransferase